MTKARRGNADTDGRGILYTIVLFFVVAAIGLVFLFLEIKNDCSKPPVYFPEIGKLLSHNWAKDTSEYQEQATKGNYAGSPGAKVASAGQHGTTSQGNTKHGDESLSWWWNFKCELKISDAAIVGFTYLLAFFTALLWWSTDGLWAEANRSADRAEKNTRILESGYVFAGIGGTQIIQNYQQVSLSPATQAELQRLGISALSVPRGPPLGTTLGASAHNHGKTPALISTIEWDLVPEGQEPPIGRERYGNEYFVGWVLGNGGYANVQLASIPTGSGTFVFFGRVKYKDLFHKREWDSKFMHRIAPGVSAEVVEGRDAASQSEKNYDEM